MAKKTYKAALSQSQGREGWTVIFRHPLLLDRATGQPGRRIRRGLGTKDRDEALALIDELNQMLADRIYWEASARTNALSRFHPIVVDIFYRDLVPEMHYSSAVRNTAIPLPAAWNTNYRQVLFLGTTGSGKTTLLRQFLGTDPVSERFPATSAAKTTVANTEIVPAPGPFRAVVTFLARDQVRDYIEECISEAISARYRGEFQQAAVRRLMNHVNQRFRLSYVLGDPDAAAGSDDFVEDESPLSEQQNRTGRQMDAERLLAVTKFLKELSDVNAIRLRTEMREKQEDERVSEELFEDALDNRVRQNEYFQAEADALMDQIEQRFDWISFGTFEKTKQGWPRSWKYESDSREDFLKALAPFSGNYAPHFGTLLTPLVDGIRVSGPFAPAWADHRPDLVLVDVEGLGHAADTAASLPMQIMEQIAMVDAVVLVDNAAQPMQAGTVAALRSIAAAGQAGKLFFCFTHLDGVAGDNLPTYSAKERYVLESAENALAGVGEQLGPFARRALRQRLQTACFFMAGLQNVLSPETGSGKRTIDRLQRLLSALEQKDVERPPLESRPIYDRLTLVLVVKQAVDDFHTVWNARLGTTAKTGFSKEHWQRIKALTRRFAESWDDEYLNLKPIADMQRELQEKLFIFMQNPIGWTGLEPDSDGKAGVFADFALLIGLRLQEIVVERLRDERLEDWQRAYRCIGDGSTFERASIIAKDIFDKAAPIPDMTPVPDRNRFLHDVVRLVSSVAEDIRITLQ